jgi:rhodanese-related sulfurtransferase
MLSAGWFHHAKRRVTSFFIAMPVQSSFPCAALSPSPLLWRESRDIFARSRGSGADPQLTVMNTSGEEDAMATSVKQMMEAANAAVPRITPAQAREMIAKGNTLLVDVRDAPEVEKSGKAAGAVHVSRGMLEFRADPESPYHDKNFAKDKTVILYCASGGRSALSGKVLKDMGYERVYNLGGFKDWAEGGGAVEKPAAPGG